MADAFSLSVNCAIAGASAGAVLGSFAGEPWPAIAAVVLAVANVALARLSAIRKEAG